MEKVYIFKLCAFLGSFIAIKKVIPRSQSILYISIRCSKLQEAFGIHLEKNSKKKKSVPFFFFSAFLSKPIKFLHFQLDGVDNNPMRGSRRWASGVWSNQPEPEQSGTRRKKKKSCQKVEESVDWRQSHDLSLLKDQQSRNCKNAALHVCQSASLHVVLLCRRCDYPSSSSTNHKVPRPPFRERKKKGKTSMAALSSNLPSPSAPG